MRCAQTCVVREEAMEETSSHDGLFRVNCGICVFSRGRACDSAHVCVCNHTWRTSDCKFMTRKSALVASLQSGVRLPPHRGSCHFFLQLFFALRRIGRPNRIIRVVARLTHPGSGVSLLTPLCVHGARHVAHEMQTSVLVARAVFVLRYWCAFLSLSFCPTILPASFRFFQREWTVAARWTFALHRPRFRRHSLSSRRARWSAAPRGSPMNASCRGQYSVLLLFFVFIVVCLVGPLACGCSTFMMVSFCVECDEGSSTTEPGRVLCQSGVAVCWARWRGVLFVEARPAGSCSSVCGVGTVFEAWRRRRDGICSGDACKREGGTASRISWSWETDNGLRKGSSLEWRNAGNG